MDADPSVNDLLVQPPTKRHHAISPPHRAQRAPGMACIYDRLCNASFADGHHGSGVGRHMWRMGSVFVIAADYESSEIQALLQCRATQGECFGPWVATFTLDRDPTAQRAELVVTFYKHTHAPTNGGASTLTATAGGAGDHLEIRWGDGNVWRQTDAFADKYNVPRAFSRTVEAVTTAGGYLAMQRRYLAIVRGAKTPQVYDRGACRITPAYMAMLC